MGRVRSKGGHGNRYIRRQEMAESLKLCRQKTRLLEQRVAELELEVELLRTTRSQPDLEERLEGLEAGGLARMDDIIRRARQNAANHSWAGALKVLNEYEEEP